MAVKYKKRSKAEQPCPFCGGYAYAFESVRDNGARTWLPFWVECMECHAGSAPFETEPEALEAWARRVL